MTGPPCSTNREHPLLITGPGVVFTFIRLMKEPGEIPDPSRSHLAAGGAARPERPQLSTGDTDRPAVYRHRGKQPDTKRNLTHADSVPAGRNAPHRRGPSKPRNRPRAPRGQFSRLFSEIYKTEAPFNGWIQGTSQATGVTGFFLNGNPAGTDLDGSDAVEAVAEFVLPFAAEEGQTVTEVTVVNINDEPATATATLYSTSGVILATKELPLEGRALVRQTLTGIFGEIDFTTAYHVNVKSDRPDARV